MIMSFVKSLIIISFIFIFYQAGRSHRVNTQVGQQFCLSLLPALEYRESLAALICGENFAKTKQSVLLTQSGLIHLFVVSGSHLVFLEQLLVVFGCGEHIIGGVLFVFLWLTGGTAPTLRAFLYWMISQTNHFEKLHWGRSQRALIAGLLSLIILGGEQTFSLLLSWTCAAILIFSSGFFEESLHLILGQQILISAITNLVYFNFNGNPIWSLAANLIAMTLMETFLFPLAVMTTVFRTTQLLDWSMHLIYRVCEGIPHTPNSQRQPMLTSLFWPCFVIFILHLVTHLQSVSRKRRSA
jgi:competence protein ComEC